VSSPKLTTTRVLNLDTPRLRSIVYTMSAREARQLEPHPLSQLFPPLDADELDSLGEDIRIHKQTHPIILHEGKILDGVHRAKVCAERGLELRCIDFEDMNYVGTPKQLVITENSLRRHLTLDQILEIDAKIMGWDKPLDIREKQAEAGREGGKLGGRGRKKETPPQVSEEGFEKTRDARETRHKLADQAGTSLYKADQLLKVHKHAPELAPEIAAGKMPLKDAAKVAEERRAKTAKPRKKPEWTAERAFAKIEKVVARHLEHVVEEDRADFQKKLIERIRKLCRK
jgi:hypothetical protein